MNAYINKGNRKDPQTSDLNKKIQNKQEDFDISQTVKLGDEERLQKLIARSGLSSRRGAESLVYTKYITYNAVIIIHLIIRSLTGEYQ